MVAGNFNTYESTIADSATGEVDISAIKGEKLVKINPGASDVRVLIPPASSTTAATATSYLLANGENEFSLGVGLDRLSLYNVSGGEVKVSVAVLS